MKKLIAIFTMIGFLFLSAAVHAGEFFVLKNEIANSRDTAITMLQNKNKRGAEYQKRAKAAAETANDLINKIKVSAGKETRFKELKDTWMAFKKTREEEVIPNILQGKEAEAKKLANTIQKERFKKLTSLCDELDN